MIKEGYKKYREVESWLKEVPEHWGVERIKNLFDQISIKGNDLKEGTYIPLENIQSFTGKLLMECSNENGEETILFKKGDLLFMKLRPYLGKVLITEFDGGVSGEVIVNRVKSLKRKTVHSRYFFYRLLSTEFIFKVNSLTDGVKMPRANPFKISALDVAVPPIEEQKAIASFLDKKTTAIDKKTALLSSKITRYEELSKSLVNEAVCRGLKKSLPYKESGIEGIGLIPSSWQVKRLKDVGYLYSGLSGKSGEHFNQDVKGNSKYYIPFTNIANNKYINNEDLHSVIMEENEKQNKVKKNDLFFLMSSEGCEDIGKAALLIADVKETYLNSFCKGYRLAKKSVVPRYLNYLLNSSTFRDKFIVEGKGFTRINLKMEKVNDFNFIIPPEDEQIAIADYLDSKTQTIDAIVKNITQQIDGLNELRKTLINDVVTGKIKVTI